MLYLGDNGPDATNYNQEIDRRVNGSPDIDWREKGKISPVKD